MSDSILIALIGLAGVVIGCVATIVGNALLFWLKECSSAKREEPRKKLLLQMLENPRYQWRHIETLMHVIGTDEEATKNLLLTIDARASEDGKPLWGLIKRNPLPGERQ